MYILLVTVHFKHVDTKTMVRYMSHVLLNLSFQKEGTYHVKFYLHVGLLCQMTFKWYTVTVIQTYFI